MISWLPEGNLKKFPHVSESDENGLLCVGGTLSTPNLLKAYQSGIFPWPHGNGPMLWFSPPVRGILSFENFHIPARVTRELKKSHFELRMNTVFREVMLHCAKTKNRKGQKGTWITDEMVEAYIRLHQVGHAISFETWKNNQLVGGLYGVFMENFFAGESMFYRESGASKFALISSVEWLKEKGLTWMDIQMVTPLLKMFGGKEISREEYFRFMKDGQ